MATDPVRLTQADPGTADAYRERYEEDSFDYPSPAPSQTGAVEAPPPSGEQTEVPFPEPRHESGEEPDTGPTLLERLLAVRRTLLLTAAAGLIVAGGFGVGLSTVGDTVPSNPAPGGTGQVSVPGPPTTPPPAPSASVPASAPGGGGTAPGVTGPTATPPQAAPSQPKTPDGRGNGQKDHEREDGDGSEDG